MDPALGIRFWVDTQVARACFGKSRGTAVTCEVALGENLNEGVLAVALNRAGVANARPIVRIRRIRGWGVAGQAGKDALS